MAIKSFSDVQRMFNEWIAANNIDLSKSPHGAFWQKFPDDIAASEDEFINGDMPGVFAALKILIRGNSAESMIIKALRGYSPFDNKYRMPPGGPYFPDHQIQELANWIDSLEPVGQPRGPKMPYEVHFGRRQR